MRKRNKTIIKADRIEHVDVAKVHNPRYLVSRDGEEVGIFPGYNALMAINAARKIYGAGKYTSVKTGEAMYLGRGALETERREREAQAARAAAKAAAKRDKIQLPKGTRRNPRRGSRSSFGSTEVQSHTKRVTSSRGKLDLYKDGIDGKEIAYGHVPGGSFSFQYALGTVEPGGEIGVFRRRAAERGTYGGWRWETYPNKIIPHAITSTSGTKNMNRRRANAEFDGMPKSIEFGARHRRTIDFGRRKRGAERDLVMAYADHLLRAVLAQNWALDDPALYLELSSKAKTAAKRKHKIAPTRAALLLDQAEEIMHGKKPNPRRGTRFYGGLTGLTASAEAFDSPRARYLTDVVQSGNATPEEYEELYSIYKRVERQAKKRKGRKRGLIPRSRTSRRNPAEKDAEHPIEVTRHFRGGPPGYLSPWQRAMAIGQAELFDTGIKLAPRAAELRAARLSNPGATKPVYQSGLKQATAAQLGRLARVGLRVGRTPTEIRSDLAATGRFTAEQIRRGLDQATTAEKRQNPFSLDLAKDGEEYDGPAFDFYVIFMHDPDGPYKNWMMFRLNEAARIRENMLSLQRSGAMPPGPQRFHIYDMRGGSTYMTDYVITIDPLTYQAPIDPETYFANPRGRSRRNPPVREIYQTFNGRPATRENSVNAPRGTPARVAQLGRLRLIRTRDGRSWKFPGDRAPFLAADSRGKLHVVGGAYRANPAGESCGEIEQIEYQTSKPHLGHENETIYYHQLGEETGVMPELEITPEGHLKIVGGDYRIEADGIHN